MAATLSHETADGEVEKAKMIKGELYYAFVPQLIRERERCANACEKYNSSARNVSRRKRMELFKDILMDTTPLPPRNPSHTDAQDDETLTKTDDPWIEAPIMIDYGWNVKLGKNVFISFNNVFLDTCKISIGDRTLVGPNVSFYSATHPLEPEIRRGTRGPEAGKPIEVGKDCWIGGSVIIVGGVKVGDGVTVGAGSVVTRDVPPYTVIAGNPARLIKALPQASEEAKAAVEQARKQRAS